MIPAATATLRDSTPAAMGREMVFRAFARISGDSPDPSFPTAIARRDDASPRPSGVPPASAAQSSMPFRSRNASVSPELGVKRGVRELRAHRAPDHLRIPEIDGARQRDRSRRAESGSRAKDSSDVAWVLNAIEKQKTAPRAISRVLSERVGISPIAITPLRRLRFQRHSGNPFETSATSTPDSSRPFREPGREVRREAAERPARLEP